MRNKVIGRTFDEERALYHLQDADVEQCTFAGPADGESVLKEARNIRVSDCSFSLRYPLWHTKGFQLTRFQMDGGTRAPIWYAQDGELTDGVIDGIKCLRECSDIRMDRCTVHSPEFGWRCKGLTIQHSEMESEYFLFESQDIDVDDFKMRGKYSFQYTKNVHIRHAVLDTKDAFWHSENVTVEDSVVKGEYLGWFSSGLTLINCQIIGTQPLCYCKDLKLVNCTMEGTDLAFEYSEVEADVQGHILSVKNPKSGLIVADSVGEVIFEDAVMSCEGEVRLRDAGQTTSA